jgi:hypothetical protein
MLIGDFSVCHLLHMYVRWPESNQAMILHTLEKIELLAVRTCSNYLYLITLSLFHMLCPGIARPRLTKVINLMNVICVHTLFCGFRVTSAIKCIGTSDIGHMPPHDWDTCSCAADVRCSMLSSGWFPGIWSSYANVSEHTVPSS